MLQKSPKPIRKSFAPYKGGPSIKRMRMFCAWSAHGRRHGARGLIPEGKPYRALACGPITSGGRIYGLPPCAADPWGGGKAPGEFSAWFACRGLKQIPFPSPDAFSTGLETRESSDLKGHEYNMPPPCGRLPERDVSTAPSRAATRCKRIGRGNALC